MLETTVLEAGLEASASQLDPLEVLIEAGGDYHQAALAMGVKESKYLALLAGSGTIPVAQALQTVGLLTLIKKLFAADLHLDIQELSDRDRAKFYIDLLKVLPTLTQPPKNAMSMTPGDVLKGLIDPRMQAKVMEAYKILEQEEEEVGPTHPDSNV